MNHYSRMKRFFARKNIYTAVAILPLAVFLRVARHYGFTDDAWMRAFATGAVLVLIIMAAFVVRRARFRDILFAFGLLFVSGAIAFLLDIKPVLAVYKRFQGSIFMLWYLLVRAVFAFAPALLLGFVYDPYEKAPVLAAVFAMAVFAWSFFFHNVMVSVVLPMLLMIALFYPVETDPA